MSTRTLLITIFTCASLSAAGGWRGNGSPADTGMNGADTTYGDTGMDGGIPGDTMDTTNGADTSTYGDEGMDGAGTDTMSMNGTIESVDFMDSTIVLRTEEGQPDTLYFNEETQIEPGTDGMTLENGVSIEAKYLQENDRKIATEIMPAGANGSNGASDTATSDTGGMMPENME